METKILEATAENIARAGRILAEGGLVAFPTETVYGLGADAMNPEAVKAVYAAKGRPSDNPMICHIARASDIGQLTNELSPDIVKLIDNFWPGPLTLVLPKKPEVPDTTTGGLKTVAVRMPDSEIALALIREAGTAIAAPSANLSGKPSPTRYEHCVHDLNGKVDAIIKGPECRVGIESTVLDLSEGEPTVLRPGLITPEDIEAVLERPVKYDKALFQKPSEDPDFKPKAPGMKYRHYAPKAEMTVLEGRPDRVRAEIERLKALNEGIGNKVGVILFEEKAFREAAHELFDRLREMDDQNVDMILAGALSDTDGVGFAVMNRMLKSAGYNIVRV